MAAPDSDDQLAALLADFLAVDTCAGKIPSGQLTSAANADDDETIRPDLPAMLAEQCAADPDRLPWPADWFDHTDSGQVAACRALWGTALIACIRTALGATGTQDGKISAIPSSWLRSKDFHMMCALAGLDGAALAERLTDPDRVPDIIIRLQSAWQNTKTSEGQHANCL